MEKSCIHYENWFDWYSDRYYQSGNFRFPSFLTALTILTQISDDNRIIVETGTQRLDDDMGAGESTRIFGSFCDVFGGTLYTVDNDDANIATSRQVTSEYSANIEYILSDSIEFLKSFDKPINLLYLDSLDFDFNDPELSQKHSLKEMEVSYDKMAQPAIVMMDDFFLGGEYISGEYSNLATGKDILAREYLLHRDWLEIYIHQQCVLLKL